MKVLFALGNEQLSKRVAEKYFEKYGEEIEYKNVFYFKALLDEVKKDKTYDRIVIKEELEQFQLKNIESLDKFIFNNIDNVTDEIEDSEIIFICSDRRTKEHDKFVERLFNIGVYNTLIGDERVVSSLCDYIKKPMNKKEAKRHLNINSVVSDGTMSIRDDEVEEVQIMNILKYYENIKGKTEEYVPAFDRIAEQYNRNQLKVILYYLPADVKKAVVSSSKYRFLNDSDAETEDANHTDYKEQKVNANKSKKKGLFSILKESKTKERQPQVTVDENANFQARLRREAEEVNNNEQANLEARAKAEAEARQQAELKTRAEQEAKAREEAEFKRQQEELRIKAEQEAKAREEAEFKRQQEELRIKAEQEAKAREEAEFKRQQEELRIKAEQEAKEETNISKQQAEIKTKAMEEWAARKEAKEKEDTEFKRQQEELKEKAEQEAKAREEAEFKKQQEELRIKAEQEAKAREEAEFKRQQEELRIKAEQEAKAKEEAELKKQEELKKKAEQEVARKKEEQDKFEQERQRLEQEKLALEEEKRKLQEQSEKINKTAEAVSNASIQSQAPLFDNRKIDVKKMVLFVGANKSGTTFLANAVGHYVASQNVSVGIIDMAKDKSLYYIYNQDDKGLRKIASECMKNLSEGIDSYIPGAKNLKIYTSVPGPSAQGKNAFKNRAIIDTIREANALVIVDADFSTSLEFFEKAQEIYIVQDMDIIKMQETTMFIRELKNRSIDMKKIKILINKYVKSLLTPKKMIQGLSYYNDPQMEYVDELFDSKVQYYIVPFNADNYAKYIDGVYKNSINYSKFTDDFKQAIEEISNDIYRRSNSTSQQKRRGLFG